MARRYSYITHPIPRLLDQDLAAGYLCLSSRGFEKLWRLGSLPEPIKLGRRNLWDRRSLDKFVDGLDRKSREKGWVLN